MNAVVIDADGRYGDRTTVWYAGTVAQCLAYAKRGGCQVLTGCEHAVGNTILASSLRDMISRGDWRVVARHHQ